MLTYQEILRSVGYPEDILCLDFESHYDAEYSLTKMSTIEYICDPRFECLGLGELWGADDGGIHVMDYIEPANVQTFLDTMPWDNYTVIVNNAFFDITVLKEKYGVIPKYIIDVKDLAKHYDARMSHKLKDLAKMYRLPPKGDTAQFKGLHWKDFTPELKQAMCDYNRTDLTDTFELFKILLPLLTNPEIELKLARHTLDLYLNPRIRFDAEKAKELSNQMFAEMVDATRIAEHTKEELSGDKSFVSLLSEALPEGEIIPMKQGKNGNIPALAKNDDGLKYLLNHTDEKVRNLVRGRQAVKSWPLHIKKIENMSAQAAVSGGLFRVPLNYYGSHCVPRGTEILTENGWIPIESWHGNEKIAQWKPNGDIVFAYAAAHDDFVDEEICYFNNGTVTGAFTKGHTIPYFTKNNVFKTCKAGDMRHCTTIPLTGRFLNHKYQPALQTRLLVAIQADGHWVLDKRQGRCLMFGFMKSRKIDRLVKHLNGLGIPHTKSTTRDGVTKIKIKWRDCPDWLNPSFKIFGHWLIEHNPEIFFEELIHWDGWEEKNSKGFAYCSCEKQNADWVQIMGTLSNRRVSINKRERGNVNWRPSYRVFISSKETTSSIHKHHWKIEKYEGLVYCPITLTGYWIARFDNKVIITGNTGRWSGAESVSPQNMGGKGRGKGTHKLISGVRELLQSPLEEKFIIADSAQIEARVLAWLAGQQDLLEGFATGEDIYSRFATRVFGDEVRKVRESDTSSARRILEIRRGFGKDAILGCGFGMGSKKFYTKCLENDDLRPLFDSGEYNFDFVDSLIKTYRKVYSNIPIFWSNVERAFKDAVKYPGSENWTDGVGVKLSECRLKFSNHHNNIQLRLPSGRVLYYRHCRLNNEGGIRWQWGDLWGGSITENIVQAIARDLLGYWILKLEEARLPVVLTAHDEVVCTSRLPEMGLRVVKNIMKSKPDWAAGLPLDVEGVISERYKK